MKKVSGDFLQFDDTTKKPKKQNKEKKINKEPPNKIKKKTFGSKGTASIAVLIFLTHFPHFLNRTLTTTTRDLPQRNGRRNRAPPLGDIIDFSLQPFERHDDVYHAPLHVGSEQPRIRTYSAVHGNRNFQSSLLQHKKK